MKKIIILIGRLGVSHHVMDFVVEYASKERFMIQGLFMTSLRKTDDSYTFPNDINLTDIDFTKLTDKEEAERMDDAHIKVFENICIQAGLNYNVKIIRDDFMDTIIDETAFSDMIIADDDMKNVHFWMNSFIPSVHCPILIIPQDASFFSHVIFAYDGNPSSIYAMKQFTYLFPWCHDKQTTLVSVLPSNIVQIDYQSQVKEWLSLHYSNSDINVFKGDVKSELPDYVNNQKNTLLVMGAFGRNALSRLFKESFAFIILKKTNVPVFIAHL